MRRLLKYLLPVIVAAMSSVLSAAEAPKVPKEYLDYYKYDPALPLSTQIKKTEDKTSYTAYTLTFHSTDGQVVPAILSIPKTGKPPYPAVLIGHGKGQDKNIMAPYAKAFAEMSPPTATLAIDFIFHGERKEAGKDIYSKDIKADVRYFAQSIRDLMRAVDYLVSRNDIDRSRIGYVGYAMGGILGGVFISVDKRVKAAAFLLAGGNWVKLIAQSAITNAQDLRESTGGVDIKDLLGPVEPNNYIGMFAPRPFLMVNQKEDRIVPPESSNAMFEAAGQPKEIIWLRGQHYLSPADAMKQLVPFFQKNLGKK